MTTEKKNLESVFPEWLGGGGILSKLTSSFEVPWKNVVDGEILDLEYYGNRSGSKEISPLLYKMLQDEILPDSNIDRVANLIFSKYNTNWKKTWDAMITEYNPLESYNVTESHDVKTNETEQSAVNNNETLNETNKLHNEHQKDTTDNTTSNSSGTTSRDENSTNKDYKNAFNGPSTSTPTENSEGTVGVEETSSSESDRNRTVNDTYTQDSTDERDKTKTVKVTSDNTEATTTDMDIQKSGNIRTTVQDLLEKEIKVRIDWNFFEIVYKNIDSVLVTNIFISEV